MPQYELTAVDDKGEDANQKDATAARNARIKRVAIIVGAVLLGLLLLILIIWGISALLGYQLLTWEQETFIESIPGIHYRTNSSEDGTGDLIWLHQTPDSNHLRWTDTINNALKPYRFESKNTKRNIVACDYNRKPPAGTVCNVDITSWRPCVAANNYNYHKSSPCVFLKFKQIPNWTPEFYNNTNQLPENMPLDLKYRIRESLERGTSQVNNVWVSCEGENAADKENIGPLTYIPKSGFPGYYFPYKEQEGYLSPLVAIFFERPRLGILINVVCKLWAPNIQHDGSEPLSQIHFELLID